MKTVRPRPILEGSTVVFYTSSRIHSHSEHTWETRLAVGPNLAVGGFSEGFKRCGQTSVRPIMTDCVPRDDWRKALRREKATVMRTEIVLLHQTCHNLYKLVQATSPKVASSM